MAKFKFKNSEYNFIERKSKSEWNFYDSNNLLKNQITLACKEKIEIIENIEIDGNMSKDGKIIWVEIQTIDFNDLDYNIVVLSTVKGITREKAKIIFEENDFKTINEIVDFIKNGGKIKGIGSKKLELILNTLEDEKTKKTLYELYTILDNKKLSDKIYLNFGEDSILHLKKNVYDTLVPLIGFKKTDKIAIEKFKIDKNNKQRIKYFIPHEYNELNVERSNFIDTNEFVNKITKYDLDINTKDILANEMLTIEGDTLYNSNVYKAENRTPIVLKQYISKVTHVEDIDYLVKQYESRNCKLDITQIDSIKSIIRNPLNILMGGAGTGKTTVTKCIIDILETEDYKCLLLAPTGKAALRMSQVTNRKANTIHSLLFYLDVNRDDISNDAMNRKYGCCIDDKIILIIDEFSMVDQELFYDLLCTCEYLNIFKIIIIGDDRQLKSVGCGKVLFDIMQASKTIKEINLSILTKTFRQKEGSLIISESNKLRNFEKIDTSLKKNEFFVGSTLQFGEILKRIRDKYNNDLEFYKNVQITTALNADVDKINEMFVKGKKPFNIGDKIVNIVNDSEREIVNGDFGIIINIEMVEIGKKKVEEMTVNFFDSKIVTKFTKDEYDQIKLAYCTTVHKLQGSEYEYIIIIMDRDSVLLDNSLIYTAVTRGKKHVIILGDERVIKKACLRRQDHLRKTKFIEKLIAEFN